MTNPEDARAMATLHETACKGNVEALDFLKIWLTYCHEIDDFCDEKIGRSGMPRTQAFLRILANANIVYSHMFFTRHAARLHMIVAGITDSYAQSLAWAGSNVEWQKQWADTLRFGGHEMVLAVAMICGGFEHMRAVSPALKEICWHTHHDEEGRPD